jgi:hypothetical protein
MKNATPSSAPAKRERDLRLDFFRGIAMFIILLAHTPGNPWTLWIPARFGFSDATEIFVFCSGMASAMAFGSVYVKRSWWLGSARIVYRVWQVYWAHIGVVIFTAVMLYLLNETQLGTPDKDYSRWFPIAGLFTRTEVTLTGLLTLTYVPGLFDILPMYLVILAMVPLVMAVYRIGGREAVFAFVLVVWLCANLAGYGRMILREGDFGPAAYAELGILKHFLWMNLPGVPWEENAVWFFNPFGWQLVFFTGFAFAMKWIPAPPVNRVLVWSAIAVVLCTAPLAWHKIYQYYTGFLPQDLGGELFWDLRGFIEPVRWKSQVGAWRFLHFLAVAYLAWAAVGQGGFRLSTGWDVVQRAASTRAIIRVVMAGLLIATVPWTYISEIKWISPALDTFFFENLSMDPRYHGIVHLIHLAALITFTWHSIGDLWRQWLVKDAFLFCVPVIRKVGTQSLAVFLVSIALSRFNGWWLDAMSRWVDLQDFTYLTPRDAWMLLLVNGTGFAVLIATAYGVGWFRRQPWRERKPASPPPDPQTAKARPIPAE